MSVLIVVLAMLAGLVLPNLPNLKRSREHRDFRLAVRRLASQAREEAILSKSPVILRADEADGRLVVEREAEDGSQGSVLASARAPAGVQFERFILATGDVNAAEWSLRFQPDGRAEGGGLELSFDGDRFYLLVRPNGAGESGWGEAPLVEVDEWEAGELERRI